MTPALVSPKKTLGVDELHPYPFLEEWFALSATWTLLFANCVVAVNLDVTGSGKSQRRWRQGCYTKTETWRFPTRSEA